MKLDTHLGVEEASHPERCGAALKQPGGELLVSIQQVGEPETERGRLPGDFLPVGGHAGVEHVVQGVAQVLAHDDGAVNSQLKVGQSGTDQGDDLLHSVDLLTKEDVDWLEHAHLSQSVFDLSGKNMMTEYLLNLFMI